MLNPYHSSSQSLPYWINYIWLAQILKILLHTILYLHYVFAWRERKPKIHHCLLFPFDTNTNALYICLPWWRVMKLTFRKLFFVILLSQKTLDFDRIETELSRAEQSEFLISCGTRLQERKRSVAFIWDSSILDSRILRGLEFIMES